MQTSFSQANVKLSFDVSMVNSANHLYHVQLNYHNISKANLRFHMCAWTPGFYEIANFGNAVLNFKATDGAGKILIWKKNADSTWDVQSGGKSAIVLNYDVKAENPFIANANLDENYGYFVPGALFMYLDKALQQPLTVHIKPYSQWPQTIATGLDPLPGKPDTYLVKNFDVLYDSPFLVGKLERFPASAVKGKRLEFIGYRMGHFNRDLFMSNLTKIATSGSEIIGDIPYNHYTFLGVGMPIHGFGGIEHLNSASVLMANNSALLSNSAIRETMYAFLAHEYFHLIM